ncbi:hypothetical protein [Tessaracoccus defluvii]|uniref:hypothetical protein n=1 Tax=Tessaracoccus defluvii TaxID=1285901 RepID=UPI001D05B1C8|nr:hypothetical protein [Tessaracoccus defluvii]
MEDVYSASIPEPSEQLDQLQPGDSLIDRGVEDVLDEGYTPPDFWSGAMSYGTTVAEQRQGETIEMRLRQEVPEPAADDPDEPWNPDKEPRQVGKERAGRLMSVQGAGKEDTLGVDVGIAGARPARRRRRCTSSATTRRSSSRSESGTRD